MTTSPRLRKFALTAHISSSVGWLGAVAGFLALAITGLTGQDAQIVRAAYLGTDWIGWFVLVPLSFASLLTGLVQSLGTEWGLFRHYWILAKLLINVLGNVGLLMFMLLFGSVVATVPASALDDVGELRSPSPLLHAGVALLVLLVATVLSVYKPRGITPYGWRKQHARCKALQRKKQHQQRAQEATGGRIAHADRSRTAHEHEHMLGVPAHVGHARAGVHSQRDRDIPGPTSTDAMTEPWSRVRTTMAAKAAAPPFTTTAMRRLSMRQLRSGSDSGSQPRDPHATRPAGAQLDADHAVVAGYPAGGDGALAGIARPSHVNNTRLTR
jgi:hypothetical protein